MSLARKQHFYCDIIYAAENGVHKITVRSQEPWKVRRVATSRTNFPQMFLKFSLTIYLQEQISH